MTTHDLTSLTAFKNHLQEHFLLHSDRKYSNTLLKEFYRISYESKNDLISWIFKNSSTIQIPLSVSDDELAKLIANNLEIKDILDDIRYIKLPNDSMLYHSAFTLLRNAILNDPAVIISNMVSESTGRDIFQYLKKAPKNPSRRVAKIVRYIADELDNKRLADEFQEELLDPFVRANSMANAIVNDLNNSNLYISIDPYHFATMSPPQDTGSWSSCFGAGGDFGGAPFLAATASDSIIAFTEMRKDLTRTEYPIKRWRETFLINDSGILHGRQYPHCNNALSALVEKHLINLMKASHGHGFIFRTNSDYLSDLDAQSYFKIKAQTGDRYYSDYNAQIYKTAVVALTEDGDLPDNHYIKFEASGENVCLCCLSRFETDTTESPLCMKCNPKYIGTCVCCSADILAGNGWISEDGYCEDCYTDPQDDEYDWDALDVTEDDIDWDADPEDDELEW